MPVWGGARWKPIYVNYQAIHTTKRIAVAHVMQGSLWGTDSWFRNKAAGVSAHFGIGMDGSCLQWVDTDHMAWAQCDGNPYCVGIETEGFAGDPMTSAQVAKFSKLMAWLHHVHPDIDLWLNKRVSGSGLGYHALGGYAWCGHLSCPSPVRVDQLHDIIVGARA